MSLIKDQYLLEYQERFEELKKSFFEQYKVDAELKLNEFMFQNLKDKLKFDFEKLRISLIGSAGSNMINILDYSVGHYIYYLNNSSPLSDRMKAFFENKISFEPDESRYFSVKAYGLPFISITASPENVANYFKWYEQNTPLIQTFLSNLNKARIAYTNFQDVTKVNASTKQYFKSLENNLKEWIQKYKDAGVEVESYEAMLEKARLASQAQAAEDKKVQTQDVPVQTVQTPAPQTPNPKKSNVLPLLAAGAAAFFFLKGE